MWALPSVAHDQGAVVVQPGVEAFDLIASVAGGVGFRLRAPSSSVLELALRDGGANALGSEPAA